MTMLSLPLIAVIFFMVYAIFLVNIASYILKRALVYRKYNKKRVRIINSNNVYQNLVGRVTLTLPSLNKVWVKFSEKELGITGLWKESGFSIDEVELLTKK